MVTGCACYTGKQVFLRRNFKFATAIIIYECLNPIKLPISRHKCTHMSKLPSAISIIRVFRPDPDPKISCFQGTDEEMECLDNHYLNILQVYSNTRKDKDKESKRQRDKETQRQRDKETKRQRDAEKLSGRVTMAQTMFMYIMFPFVATMVLISDGNSNHVAHV